MAVWRGGCETVGQMMEKQWDVISRCTRCQTRTHARDKAQAEIALAERRVALDQQLAISKRKAEVAEKVLADFYEAARAFEIIRSRMIWAQEMVPEQGVSEDVVRNSGYGVIALELRSDIQATGTRAAM